MNFFGVNPVSNGGLPCLGAMRRAAFRNFSYNHLLISFGHFDPCITRRFEPYALWSSGT
jgi:hypothetical protein